MIIIEFLLLFLFLNEILNTDNVAKIVVNAIFLLATLGSIIYEFTKKQEK